MEATFLIVGGGIAGVSCAETLAFYQPTESIILLSESSLIKKVVNLIALTPNIINFDIEETEAHKLTEHHSNIKVVHDSLLKINSTACEICTLLGNVIKYKYLCLCMGGKPKLIPLESDSPYIIGIRDTESVAVFLDKLKSARKVAIIGNGGIASEIVYKIQHVLVDWIIKDKHISATFIDPGAAEFLKHNINEKVDHLPKFNQQMRYDSSDRKAGAALGPNWYKDLKISGSIEDCLSDSIKIHFGCEVTSINIHPASEYPVEILLNNNDKVYCDFIISATGIEANTDFEIVPSPLELSDDKGICVNEYMQSSVPNIYAAGDICTANWEHAKQWFPMKLWTQARQMGAYAAKCMSSTLNKEVILQDFCFELFTHTTKLFGYKLVLLGLFNGQKLGMDYEVLFRMTKNKEYIKFVLQNGRLQGALLIGDTDLEETCENLILNQIDLSDYKEDLLNPDVDIEDYFD